MGILDSNVSLLFPVWDSYLVKYAIHSVIYFLKEKGDYMLDFNKDTLFHIGLCPEQGASLAILTGDPGRVEEIARKFDDPVFVASNREFTTWAAQTAGKRLLVTSHGIGGPSTAICIEELYRCGVRTMIRVGTCGGMQMPVMGGDVVIATGAIRQEGTTGDYLPLAFPAVADFTVTQVLTEAAKELKQRYYTGVVHCKDSFYGQHDPAASPVAYQLENQWHAWIKGGCLASEMESAALFILGAVKGIRTGCVLQVLWNQERAAAGLANPQVTTAEGAVEVAVKAVKSKALF